MVYVCRYAPSHMTMTSFKWVLSNLIVHPVLNRYHTVHVRRTKNVKSWNPPVLSLAVEPEEYLRDIEVYEFQNGKINFTKSAVPYPSGQLDYLYGVSPLFLVDRNFCSV